MSDLHVRHNTFPGEVLMELSADALHTAGIERETGVAYRELLRSICPKSSSAARRTGASNTQSSPPSQCTADSSRICSMK